MLSSESNSNVKTYSLLNNKIMLNLVGFLLLLLIVVTISSVSFSFLSNSVAPDNPRFTNSLAVLIITLAIGSLTGTIVFLTISMNKEINSRIDNAFNDAKVLAIENQAKTENLIAELRVQIAGLNSNNTSFSSPKESPVNLKVSSDKDKTIDKMTNLLGDLYLLGDLSKALEVLKNE